MQRNFLFTILIALFASLVVVGYIIWRVPPSPYMLIGMLFLVGFIANLSASLILYKFSKPRGYESDRQVFRRAYKRSIVFGLFVILLLVVQKVFDIL